MFRFEAQTHSQNNLGYGIGSRFNSSGPLSSAASLTIPEPSNSLPTVASAPSLTAAAAASASSSSSSATTSATASATRLAMKLSPNSDSIEAAEAANETMVDEGEDDSQLDNLDNLSDSDMAGEDRGEAGTGSAASKKGTPGTTACAVCLEVTDNRHIHYGALCCFSCRAFFRRANQENR